MFPGGVGGAVGGGWVERSESARKVGIDPSLVRREAWALRQLAMDV